MNLLSYCQTLLMGGSIMSVMVSARVPRELHEQVSEMLRDMGVSTTQLINGAYRQFRDTGKLPGEREAETPMPGMRTLAPEQQEDLARSIHETTRRVPESYFADATYDDMLERELRARYEALA